MKELSVEEKAKRYNEALKRAKDMLSYKEVRREDMEYLFPELKENEDERIRKAIVATIHLYYGEPLEDEAKEMLAWLEKQRQSKKISIWKHWKDGIAGSREGKPIFLIKNGNTYNLSSCLGFECDYILLSDLDKCEQAEQKETLCDKCKKAQPSHSCQDITALGRCALEKQCEKPCYSIGDVLCDKSCTTLNKDAQPNFEIVDIRNGMYICDKCSFPISQQDEYELVAKKIEQKPTDEEIKTLLRTEYEKGRADAIAEMQKPAWSEEDERMFERILQQFMIANNDCKLHNASFTYDKEISFLKSLRPQNRWKPSDEQMKALHELYNDLKKLAEE